MSTKEKLPRQVLHWLGQSPGRFENEIVADFLKSFLQNENTCNTTPRQVILSQHRFVMLLGCFGPQLPVGDKFSVRQQNRIQSQQNLLLGTSPQQMLATDT